jgi:hypothetical protein
MVDFTVVENIIYLKKVDALMEENKRFVILFDAHEGSSATISYLKNFTPDNLTLFGFEPFEMNNFEEYRQEEVPSLISLLFSEKKEEFLEKYNAMKPKNKDTIFPTGNVFFKLRTDHVNDDVISTFKEHNITVFVLFRKNMLKHCLSIMDPKLQFEKKVITSRKVYDVEKFKKDLVCIKEITRAKREKYLKLKNAGINVKDIYYEDLLKNKDAYIKGILTFANIPFDNKKQVSNCYFKKVHPDNIANFVSNYHEIMAAYRKLSTTA